MESSRIFVRDLPPSCNEQEFRKHFASKHAITDVKFLPRRRIGYVGFESSQDAQSAVKYFNKTFIRMSRIHVELARSVRDLVAARQFPVSRSPDFADLRPLPDC